MNGHQRFIQNPKVPAEVAIVACVFATLLYDFERTLQRYGLFDTVSGVTLEILSRLILLVWQSVPSYLYESSMVLGHLLYIATSLWPLFCAVWS
jgi:hypothetical protein